MACSCIFEGGACLSLRGGGGGGNERIYGIVKHDEEIWRVFSMSCNVFFSIIVTA